jgi:hypothetical protein
MPITVARKLQALCKIREHDDLEIQVFAVCLTRDQVAEFGLPESPLKPGEKRSAAWKAAMGYEQVELDALAALRPELLEEIARKALEPFFDFGLADRVEEAKEDYERQADEALAAYPALSAVNARVAEVARTYNRVVEYVNRVLIDASDELQPTINEVELPEIPEPEVSEDPPTDPLLRY